jgi:hypothetical protein
MGLMMEKRKDSDKRKLRREEKRIMAEKGREAEDK